MAKRFVDTEMFSDDWFMDLSKDGKIMWFYLITMCDHAGIFKLNERLCKFHTGVAEPISVIEQLGNRIVRVREQLYFIPKFIEFQYPNFPNSKVMQQQSAVAILERYGLFVNGLITLPEDLNKSYDNGNGNNKGGAGEKEPNISFDVFWDAYGKKVGNKSLCIQRWNKLKDEDRQKIIDTLPSFIASVSDIKYLPYPEKYLNAQRWNDEVTAPASPVQSAAPQNYPNSKGDPQPFINRSYVQPV